MFVARHAQITQNNKFAISLQYLTKEVSDEVDLLYAEQHECFPINQTIVLTEMVKHFESYQTTISQQVFRDEVDFLHADEHQS